MALRILQLRAALALAALRPGTGSSTRRIFTTVLFAGFTAFLCWWLLDLRTAQAATAETVIVLGIAAFCILVLVYPLLFGADDPIDPRRFSALGLNTTKLPWQLLVAGLVSLSSVCSLAISICIGLVVYAHGASALLSALVVLGLFLTLYLFQVVGVAGATAYHETKQPREALILLGVIVVMLAAPFAVFALSQLARGALPEVYKQVARIVEFTPFGAAAGWGFLAADDATARAWIVGIITIATIVALAFVWLFFVNRALTLLPRQATARDRSLGWFAVLPKNATGAVAARSLLYWSRDRRYTANLLAVPIAAVLCAIPPAVVSAPRELVFMLPILVAAWFFGWIPHNDIAYDSSALWTHAVSGMNPIADRLGRLVPTALVAIPTLAVATPIACALAERVDLLPALSGVAVALLLTGFGVSSVFSALTAYPVPKPGSSPFQQPQRTSMRGPAGQTLVLLLTALISAPVIWLGVQSVESGVGVWQVATIGIVVGLLMLAVGVLIGAALIDRRWATLLTVADAS